MAQSAIAVSTSTDSAAALSLSRTSDGSSEAALSAVDLEKIHEYQKIVAFRDTILAGKHPRIKVPASTQGQGRSSAVTRIQPNATTAFAASAASASEAPAAASASAHPLPRVAGVNGHRKDNVQSFNTNSQQPPVALTGNKPPATPSNSKNLNSGKTEFNPVLLEKSQGLIKAETHLQRQRIEKSLKDQVEERRKATLKSALQQPDRLQELDLTDILAKALTLVQATSAPIIPDANLASNATDSGDSFDDNTFYSSQHVTPEFAAAVPSPQTQKSPADVQMQDDTAPDSPPQNDAYSPTLQFNPQPLPIPAAPLQQAPIRQSAPLDPGASMAGQYLLPIIAPANSLSQNTTAPQIPQTSIPSDLARPPHQRYDVEPQVISSGESGSAGDSGNTDSDQPTDSNRMQSLHQPPPHSANLRIHEPRVIRAHDLSPYAPQPAHVSPLAIAHQPPITQPDISILQAAPAPVAALRQQQPITSPESSPQGDKGSKKKANKKKNKRKAETRTHTAPGSPDIKPEPRSPSPLSAQNFARPPKRQRPLQRQVEELAYDEPMLGRPASRVQREYHEPVPVQDRLPYSWEGVEEPYARQIRYSAAPPSQRPEHVVYEDRRSERVVYEDYGPDGAPVQYVRRIQSPPRYAAPYGSSEARPIRSASYSVAQPIYQEASAYPVDGRTSVRPYPTRGRSRSPVMTDRRSPHMAPPAVPPSRIIVDEYGRQYIEPPRPASTVRPVSVMPTNRPGEPEIIYERASMRAGSRIPGADTFEQDGVLYRRASPAMHSRRVVTQPPDYRGMEYRGYRERDYPIQPAREAPPEYIQYGGAAERRLPEDYSREYVPRPISVRPVEVDPYRGRLQSTRPEVPPRQFTTSVRPEAIREAMPPVVHEYGARPTEADLPRREFSVRPVERYYERPLPRDDEVTYIERPRAAQPEVVYAEDPRGPVYHHG